MRTHYWSCSKLADWIRGTAKPASATGEGWSAWRKLARSSHPFRYWLADDALHFVQTVVYWPADRLNDLRYYINNRWVTHSHSLTAHSRDIKPGDWCDVGNRFLPCLFNELVNYIEVEKAWMQCCWGQKENQAKYNMPWWRNHWWARWGKEWRCPQAGLDHLAWEMNLTFNEEWIDKNDPNYNKPTHQAIAAKEQYDLYMWWTQERPKRPDAYDASGWSELCERRREAARKELGADKDDFMLGLNDRTDEERAESRRVLDLSTEIENKYSQEDEEMMIRLIKIRNSLWT